MKGPGRPAVLALVLASLLALSPASPAGALDVPGSGGVEINGTLLPAGKVWAEYRYNHALRAMLHEKGGEVDPVMLKRAVDYTVRMELLSREAARRGYELTDEDRRELRERQVKGWKGEKNLQTALAMIGVDEAFVLARAGGEHLVFKMAVGEAGAEEGIDEGQLKAFYDANLDKFIAPGPTVLSRIFLPRGEPGLKVDRDYIRDEILVPANELREAGKRYDSLVEKFSRYGGGAVDEAAADPPPFFAQGKVLKPCRISQTFGDDAGWSIYLRDCPVPEPFAGIHADVRSGMVSERRRAFVEGLFADLMQKADLKYLDIDPDKIPGLAKSGKGH